MPSAVVLLLLVAMAAVVVAAATGRAPWMLRAAAAPGHPAGHPAGHPLAAFRTVAPVHVDEALRTAAAFKQDYLGTFGAPGPDPATRIRRLFAHRARALRLLNEARLRLPNDLDAERRLAAAIEDVDRSMLERIEDARDRGGAPLVHPGPVDAAWYGQWYRAANDTVA